jgi:predicted SnoaL-like aldol condensation-catalyzing enzyme
MLFHTATLLTLSVITSALAADPYCPPRSATAAEQATIFNEFINTFVNQGEVIKALQTHAADTYVQHNPSAMSGRENTINFFKGLPPGAKTTREIINQGIGSNNTGFVHYKMTRGEGKPQAVVDVYRMEGTCVMEHWDVMQERPTGAKNPLAMWS